MKIVKTAKKADMVKKNEACSYREPEKQIISRAGDECVVAVCDQELDLKLDLGWKFQRDI